MLQERAMRAVRGVGDTVFAFEKLLTKNKGLVVENESNDHG